MPSVCPSAGHSSTQSSLLTSGSGFEALFFARMDYQVRELTRRQHRLYCCCTGSHVLNCLDQQDHGRPQAGLAALLHVVLV